MGRFFMFLMMGLGIVSFWVIKNKDFVQKTLDFLLFYPMIADTQILFAKSGHHKG